MSALEQAPPQLFAPLEPDAAAPLVNRLLTAGSAAAVAAFYLAGIPGGVTCVAAVAVLSEAVYWYRSHLEWISDSRE